MNMFFMNLLTGENPDGPGDMNFIFLALIVVVFIVFVIHIGRNNKKRQQEQENVMNAIRPGNKVKTIGGICGIIVEVNQEENTFVLETGNETNGKSYIKFDKQAIYQTDAKVEPKENKAENEADKQETAND